MAKISRRPEKKKSSPTLDRLSNSGAITEAKRFQLINQILKRYSPTHMTTYIEKQNR